MSEHYDILIVGAGLVGASLALLLANTTLRVAISEAALLQTTVKSDADGRSLALTYGSVRILEKLQLWSTLAPDAVPIQTVHVSNRGHLGITRIHARDEGVPALGYVIPAALLGAHLQQALLQTKQLTILNPVKVTALTKIAQTWQVDLHGAQNITADLIVAADGSNSLLRELQGITTEIHDYEQSALVTTVQLQRAHHNIAYERFVADGALAMLPRAGLQCAAIWTGPQQKIAALMAQTDTEYLQALQSNFGYRLGRLLSVGKRFTYPLKMLIAKEQVRDGFVLIGNAAHTIHPIAAQGFNLGLSDAALLAQTIVSALNSNKIPGSLAVLQAYAQQRQATQARTINFTDALTKLFAHDVLPVNMLRSGSLLALDFCAPLKHRLARRLMGVGYV